MDRIGEGRIEREIVREKGIGKERFDKRMLPGLVRR